MAKPLVEPSLLATLAAGLLEHLLAPHHAFLEGRHILLGDDTSAWRARLADVLNGDDPALPAALQFALSAVGDLAAPEGEGGLRALGAERGVVVPVARGRAPDVAAWAYLDERALFRHARARVCAAATSPAAVHGSPPGRGPRSPLPSGDGAPNQGRDDEEEEPDGKVERFRR